MSALRACVRESHKNRPRPNRAIHRFERVRGERVCRDCGYVGECFDPMCSCNPCDQARKNDARRAYYTNRRLIRELRRIGVIISDAWDTSVSCEMCGANPGEPCLSHCVGAR